MNGIDREPIPINRSLVQVKVGGRVYDAVRDPRCHTCTHPARHEIEELITQGYSYRGVASTYSEVDWQDADGKVHRLPKLSFQSVFYHFKHGHMPATAEAMRRIIERRAEKIGAAQYEKQIEQIVDQHIFAEQVLVRAQERLAKGEIEPEVKDGIAAAKFLQEVEAQTQQGLDVEAWSAAMQRYFEIAQQMMPPDMWHHFTQTLSRDPILRSIAARSNQQQIEDAEIVDNPESD